jgi:hypothetical protein
MSRRAKPAATFLGFIKFSFLINFVALCAQENKTELRRFAPQLGFIL